MLLTRRFMLAAAGTALIARRAVADDLPPLADLMSQRGSGDPAAPVMVEEFFSMTCTHCAAFSREVMPQITERLITPGKLRFVYHDYPLDQIAMTAAMVARALPASRYPTVLSALFASQDRWAFAPEGGNATEALWKEVAIAGITRARFDAVVADDALRQAIATAQQQATDAFKISSTPTFRCKGTQHAGELDYAEFTDFVGIKG